MDSDKPSEGEHNGLDHQTQKSKREIFECAAEVSFFQLPFASENNNS